MSNQLLFARLSEDGTHMLKVYENSVKLQKNGIDIWEKHEWRSTKFSTSISPDNRFFTLGIRRFLTIHNCTDGSLIEEIGEYRGQNIMDVSWSPCSRYIAVACGEVKNGLYVWDSYDGSIREFSYHAHGVSFSPDGKYLSACGRDENVSVWDTTTWEQKELDNQPELWCTTWSPDGAHLVATGREITLIYDTHTLGHEPPACIPIPFCIIEIKPSVVQKNWCLLYNATRILVLDCDSKKFIECFRIPATYNTLSSFGVIYPMSDRAELLEPNTHKIFPILSGIAGKSKKILSDPRIWQKVLQYTLD